MEVMVAIVVLSVIALGLTSTLIAAQRARVASERWTQAVALAVEGVERLRAGQPTDAIRLPGSFRRSGTVTPWNGHVGLYRIDVRVSWNDGRAHDFRLVTLGRR